MHFVESARKEGTSRTVVALQMHSVGVLAEVDVHVVVAYQVVVAFVADA